MMHQLHFLNENSVGSELYKFYEWRWLDANFDVAKVKFDQCQAGLRGRKTGLPIKKRIEVWASHASLVAPLAKLQ
eukprot:4209009-Heterocapsa_arctica.AAC.1